MVHTPQREPKRTPFRELMQEVNFPRSRVLSQSFVRLRQSSDTQEKWSDAEIRALIVCAILFQRK